jgi:hypothetical protein
MTPAQRTALEALRRSLNDHTRYLRGLSESGDCGHWLEQHVINFQADVGTLDALLAPTPGETDADAAYAEECRQAADWYRARAAPPDLVALVREWQEASRGALDDPFDPNVTKQYRAAERALLSYPLGERLTTETP